MRGLGGLRRPACAAAPAGHPAGLDLGLFRG